MHLSMESGADVNLEACRSLSAVDRSHAAYCRAPQLSTDCSWSFVPRSTGNGRQDLSGSRPRRRGTGPTPTCDPRLDAGADVD